MKIINLSIFVFIVAASILYKSPNVFACSPPVGGFDYSEITAQQSFDGATIVFSGKAISIKNDGKYGNGNFLFSTTTFEVSKYWKGNVAKSIQVITIDASPACQSPYRFVEGTEYLVYATRYDSNYTAFLVNAHPAGLKGTQPLKDASIHLTFLGKGQIPQDTIVSTTTTSTFKFLKNLSTGMTGEDVRELQKYLNKNSFTVAVSGVGSIGNESIYFGTATKAALIRFQTTHSSELGIVQGTGYFGPLTRNLINK